MPRNLAYDAAFGMEWETRRRLYAFLQYDLTQVEVDVCLRFLCSTDSMEKLSAQFPRGWKKSSLSEKIEGVMQRFANAMKPYWIDPFLREPLNEDEKHAMLTLFGDDDIFGGLDSAPIESHLHVPGAAYNGHYKKVILKFLFICTHRGFIAKIAGPFHGTSYDRTLIELSGWDSFLQELGRRLLGDGHFSGSYVVNQHPKSEFIKAYYDSLIAEEGSEGRWDVPWNILRDNDRHGFVRARTEHGVSPNALGRFKRIKKWTHDNVVLLSYSLTVAAAVHNFDLMCRHGKEGKYAPMDEAWLKHCQRETHTAPFARHKWRDVFNEGKKKKKITEPVKHDNRLAKAMKRRDKSRSLQRPLTIDEAMSFFDDDMEPTPLCTPTFPSEAPTPAPKPVTGRQFVHGVFTRRRRKKQDMPRDK